MDLTQDRPTGYFAAAMVRCYVACQEDSGTSCFVPILLMLAG